MIDRYKYYTKQERLRRERAKKGIEYKSEITNGKPTSSDNPLNGQAKYIWETIQRWGEERTAMLTLTIPQRNEDFRSKRGGNCVVRRAVDLPEAKRMLKPFMRRLFKQIGKRPYFGVIEATQKGIPHLHILFKMDEDVQSGFDHEKYKRLNENQKKAVNRGTLLPLRHSVDIASQCSSNEALGKINTILRPLLKVCGFGQISGFLPVISGAEAVAKYLSKSSHEEKRRLKNKCAKNTRLIIKSRDMPPLKPKKPVSEWWKESLAIFREIFVFNEDRDFSPYLASSRWSMPVMALIGALDWVSESLPKGDRWRNRGACGWTAATILELLRRDLFLREKFERLIPLLESARSRLPFDCRQVSLGSFVPQPYVLRGYWYN